AVPPLQAEWQHHSGRLRRRDGDWVGAVRVRLTEGDTFRQHDVRRNTEEELVRDFSCRTFPLSLKFSTMSSESLHPIQYNLLPEIKTLVPVNSSERECLQEVRQVLERHGCLARFGIALLHSHFSLEDDEVLVETTNLKTRTLTARPVHISEVNTTNLVETLWR